jgi:hypothetical protein
MYSNGVRLHSTQDRLFRRSTFDTPESNRRKQMDDALARDKLKLIVPMPESWAKQMRYTEFQMKQIREYERLTNGYIKFLNRNSSYLSPSIKIAHIPAYEREWEKRPSAKPFDFHTFNNFLRQMGINK